VLGLDGCPGGWAGVLVSDTEVVWRRYDRWADGLRAALDEKVDMVAVDIPIGLPLPGTTRTCDVLARKLLGPRRSSAFPAPPRALLSAADHTTANALSRELAGDVGTKHSATGLERRETALRQALPPFDLSGRPPRVRRDDALDALACAWSARRWIAGAAVLVPDDPPRDERGLFQGIAG